MSCQRLNIGFSPSSPDNNNKNNLYNKQFDRIIEKPSHKMYYDINKSKEFITADDNNNLMTGESYNLLMDMVDSPQIKIKKENRADYSHKLENFNDYVKKKPNHLDKVVVGLKKYGIDSEKIKKIDIKILIIVILAVILIMKR